MNAPLPRHTQADLDREQTLCSGSAAAATDDPASRLALDRWQGITEQEWRIIRACLLGKSYNVVGQESGCHREKVRRVYHRYRKALVLLVEGHLPNT